MHYNDSSFRDSIILRLVFSPFTHLFYVCFIMFHTFFYTFFASLISYFLSFRAHCLLLINEMYKFFFVTRIDRILNGNKNVIKVAIASQMNTQNFGINLPFYFCKKKTEGRRSRIGRNRKAKK